MADLHTTNHHTLSSYSVFNNRFLVTDLGSGDPSASVVSPLLAGYTPQLKCQLNYSASASQPPLQNSTLNRQVTNSQAGRHFTPTS
jgi:hypothetical protein